MKRIIVLLLCLLTLSLMPGCSSSDGDDGGGGGGGTAGVTGTWSGGGTYTQVSNGTSTNQNFTLTLNLTDGGGFVTGTFAYVRTSVNLVKNGSVSGMASGGAINITFSDPALSMTGTYSGNTMSIILTESFTSGSVAWIRGSGSLGR